MNDVSAIVRAGSIEQLCGHRARALDLYEQAVQCMRDAIQAHSLAADTKHPDTEFLRDVRYRIESPAEIRKQAREAMDRQIWNHLIDATKLGSFMHADAKKDFRRQLEKNVPEVTPETAAATLGHMATNAPAMMREGLVAAFARLSGRHRTNDGFKIGPKAIWRSGATWTTYEGKRGFFRIAYRAADELRDIERCFYVLDGKPPPTGNEDAVSIIEAVMHKEDTTEAHTPYMRAVWHKNGTVHLHFSRPDLLARVNRMIAEHYGATLGAGPDAR